MSHEAEKWAVTKIAHPALRGVSENCQDCLALAEPAIIHARVTGSVGATYGVENTEDPTAGHSATVARTLAIIEA